MWSIDPNLPVGNMLTMKQHVAGTITTPRFFAFLLTLFASSAFTLAAIGVYGIVLYLVEQRGREIGIRLALGTDQHTIIKWAIFGGMKWVGMGLALGLAVCLVFSRLLSNMVFGISTTDPPTYAAAAAAFLVVALLACYVPARQATRTDPAETLRSE